MILKFDNRSLIEDMEVTRMTESASSGSSTLTLENTTGFSADDYILLENFGIGIAEVIKITSVDDSTTVTLSSATSFGHSVDCIITRLRFNQVNFAHAATVAGAKSSLTTVNLSADNFYTTYEDTSNTSGYGFARPYNSNSTTYGDYEASQPYGGYASNSIYHLKRTAYSNLTDKDRQFFTEDDLLDWLNEGYDRVYNALAQVNNDFFLSTQTISVVANDNEYDLASDFHTLLRVYEKESDGDVKQYNQIHPNTYTTTDSGDPEYFSIFGTTLQLHPVPITAYTLYVDYQAKSARATSDDDTFSLPKVDLAIVSIYATMRGKMKANNWTAAREWERMWNDLLAEMKIYARHLDRSKRSFEINDEQLV